MRMHVKPAHHNAGRASPKTIMDIIAVKLKLKDVVATAAVSEDVTCIARVKEVVSL